MNSRIVLVTVLAIAGVNPVFASGVSLETKDGASVTIDDGVFLTACERHRENVLHEFNVRTEDDGGTVSFSNPRFFVAGKMLPIGSSDIDNNYDRIGSNLNSCTGFCVSRGFTKCVTGELLSPTEEAMLVVRIAADGKVEDYRTLDTSGRFVMYYRSITCKK